MSGENRIYPFWKETKDSINYWFDWIFFTDPRFLFPLRFFAFLLMMLVNIATMRIHIFPRKFASWDAFCMHVGSIIDRLRENGHVDWADEVFHSLYVSQSFYEVQGELLRVLPALKKQKIAKQLKLKKDISKAISFLKSL